MPAKVINFKIKADVPFTLFKIENYLKRLKKFDRAHALEVTGKARTGRKTLTRYSRKSGAYRRMRKGRSRGSILSGRLVQICMSENMFPSISNFRYDKSTRC